MHKPLWFLRTLSIEKVHLLVHSLQMVQNSRKVKLNVKICAKKARVTQVKLTVVGESHENATEQVCRKVREAT